ncbi:MAG: TetR/AcrR family transcriptional regulator [Candidatus Kapaibacteriota bacterium]
MKKAKKKKESILSSSLIIFARDGFYNAKMSDIANHAGIGTGTLYLYFENKEQILKELLVDIWTTVSDELIKINNKTKLSASQKIRNSAKRIYELAKNKSQIARMVLQEYAIWNDPSFEKLNNVMEITRNVLAKMIKDGIDSGEFRPDIIPTLAVPFLIGAVWNFIEFSLQNNNIYNDEILLHQIQILVENSFAK